MSKEQSGWTTNTAQATIYHGPKFRWYQFLKKRRFAKNMARLSPGTRMKLKQPTTFTDNYSVVGWYKVTPDQPKDNQ